MEAADLERERDAVLTALAKLARDTPAIEGFWLQGSLAGGEADALSDIDAYLAVRDEALDALFTTREALVGTLRPILAWADGAAPGLKCVHALLDGGVRLDLFFEATSRVEAQARPQVQVIVDKADLARRLRMGWTAPTRVIGQTLVFIIRMTRQGGTWPLRVLRRGQWSTFAMIELDLVNAQIAQLMAVQIDPALFYQNTFSLSRRLTEAQREELDHLTAEVIDQVDRRDARALLSTHLEILDALIREGRAACDALGVAYPITEDGDAKLRQFLQAAWPR